jgi:hypothetical protein
MGLYQTGMAVLWGDVDGDKIITASDASNALNYSLNKDSNRYSPAQLLAMDVTVDGYYAAANAALILQKSLNLDYKMPVEVK